MLSKLLIHTKIFSAAHLCIAFAATSGDYSTLSSTPVSFSSQSVNGTRVCSNLTALADNLVEYRNKENFTVLLEFMTFDEAFIIGNDVTTVTIIDMDSM